MGRASDFVIRKGVLKKYIGTEKDIVIPKGVTSIGESAFRKCENLTSVTIPEGVTSIGAMAFSYCDNLTSITIPDSVTSIGAMAFAACESLASIRLPHGLASIGKGTFGDCHALTEPVIPDSVKTIGEKAFYRCGLKSITIPDSVTDIGDSAFCECYRLEKATIPGSVMSIGKDAFRNCEKLNSITIRNGVTNLGDYMFGRCNSLTGISIPDSVTNIGQGAFYFCTGLQSIVIPNSVTNVGPQAFIGCSSLTDITLSSNLTSIPEKMFSMLFTKSNSLTSVIIPDGVTSIGKAAFYKCSALQSITIPDSVTRIDDFAFCGCTALQSITIPDSVKSIGASAFRKCEGLKDADGFVIIRDVLYSYHGKETAVTIPDRVKSISDMAFEGPGPLKSIKIPACVTSVGKSVFRESGIVSVSVDPNNQKYCATGGVLFSKDGKKLLAYPPGKPEKRYSVPEGTVQLADYSVKKTGLELLLLPRTVKRLVAEATDVPYVAHWYPKIALHVKYPVFLGGKLSKLPFETRYNAVKGFLYAVSHGITEIEPFRSGYLKYIGKNITEFYEDAINDEVLFRIILDGKILSKNGCDILMKEAEEQGRADLIAALLEYRRKCFGDKDNGTLSLSDNDPEFKRMQKMAARREAIENQNGIKGIVFALTGGTSSFSIVFGNVELQSEKELKDYIEKHGGIYRSTVSSNTDYLICNVPGIDTVKSRKAKELGIPIINEFDFLYMAEAEE